MCDNGHPVIAFMTYAIRVCDDKNTALIQCLQHLCAMTQCLYAKNKIS